MKLCVEGSKLFSTCGKRQYMSIILDEFNHVVGIGYNGGPKGMKHCADGGCPRFQEGTPSGSSYDNCIAIHAEANALLHSDYSGRKDGCKLWVNGPPCFSCAKLIANSGIKDIYYLHDPNYIDHDTVLEFFDTVGIQLHCLGEKEDYASN